MSTIAQLGKPSKRIEKFGQDVWSIFSPMAVACDAVNLGQGFPNFESPAFIKAAARDAVDSNVNQYSPPKGLPRLRKALAKNYGKLMHRNIDIETELIITAGANEGMYASFLAFLNDGDEVICFEPFFDQYAPNISMSGGKIVHVPLRAPTTTQSAQNLKASDWKVSIEELESKISPKTRMIILNTPHNPIGKVFTRQELEQIAAVAIKHELLVISDEVYDRLVYDDAQHVRMATLPGMWDRTITVGSAGKSFCVTGWRVGWLIGPQHLIHPSLIAHSRIVFCTNAPLQDAIASGLEQVEEGNGFFEQQVQEYQSKRDFLAGVFQEIGVPITIPEGSYFILADISRFQIPESELQECEATEAKFCLGGRVPPRSYDWQVCRWLTVKMGVAAIPPSEFYGEENRHLAEKYARFCFCKTQETLDEARKRLLKLKDYIRKDH